MPKPRSDGICPKPGHAQRTKEMLERLVDSGLSSTDRLILLVLALHCDNSSKAHPSCQTIARLAGCTREHVQKNVLPKLCELGIVEKTSRGYKRMNHYRLCLMPTSEEMLEIISERAPATCEAQSSQESCAKSNIYAPLVKSGPRLVKSS
ncbi:MAG: Helix-turn-helix domain, partial [Candidatus Sumerlaeota bacterium]|nr:Helix-turn-helix domain [Candidatus Sumerlaeota bacterium]